MKNLIIIVSLLFSAFCCAQVDQGLKDLELLDGVMYVTYGHRITQEFSELEFREGVGVFPKTNLAYLTYKQLTVLMQDSAKNEGWDQQRYMDSRNRLHDECIGGRLILYVERFDIFETNTKLFFIIIRDLEEEKLLEISLAPRPADLLSTYLFSNWAFVNLDKELPEQFNVYVNHKMSIRLSDTKFQIHQNSAPLYEPKNEVKK